MLAIGRALVGSPELLILDEPTEGLAPVIVDMLEDRLQAIKLGGTTILLVEPFQMARRIADHVYVLSQGRIQFSGTPVELEKNEGVKNRFLGI